MATITIYKTELTPARNALVDELETYLSGCVSIEEQTVQYEKIGLDMSIKLALSQTRLDTQSVGNYAKIVQGDSIFYFFITGYTWMSKNTIQLQLSIDSINTFRYDVEFSDKTTITRQHVDRFRNITKFTENAVNTLKRNIDNVDEGISSILKLKTSDSKIQDTNVYTRQNWYLVYKTPSEPTSTTPVDCYLMPQRENICYKDITTTTTVTYNVSNFDIGYYYYWLESDNPNGIVSVAGTTIDFSTGDFLGVVFYRDSAGGFTVWGLMRLASGDLHRDTITTSTSAVTTWSVSNKIRRGDAYTQDLSYVYKNYTSYTLSAGIAGSWYLKPISWIDRTDATIVKIIECPYVPVEMTFPAGIMAIPDGWEVTNDSILKLSDLTTEFTKTFSNVLTLPLTVTTDSKTLAQFRTMQRDDKYESKLYNSNFYTYKVAYDSYSTELSLENVTDWTSRLLSIEYKQSNNITSDLGFKIDDSTITYNSIGDYDFYILSTRNNESPIYTNAYLDYKRTGAYYDRKNATTTEIGSYIGAAASIAGAAASFLAAGATGGISLVAAVSLTTTAITSLTSAITTTISSERSIQEKITSAKAQATQVNGADDLDLLKWYNGNKVHQVTYEPTAKMKSILGDLFYYCGYAYGKQEVPDTTSRYWFNYVQADIVFNEVSETDVFHDYLEDIKARYSAGVTVYHVHDGDYDWNQNYENWEVGFVND